jgi:predicted component of type VI protein secretion system
MNFVTKKHLPRRAFLRGAGVTLALPLLDSMIPAQTPLSKTAAKPKSRLGAIYVPHGAYMARFTPTTEGTGFEFPFVIKPLEKFRDRINVVSNLCHKQASGKGSDAGADHARSAAVYLSGAHPEKGSIRVGITMDQLAAQHIGQDTALPSLELAIEDVGLNCGSGYGCAYINTISWRTPTLPQPMENSPQVVFEKLFGDGSNAEQRLNRKTEDHSILDSIAQNMGRLQSGLGSADRARISEYMDDIREIERRIQRATKQNEADVKVPEAPVGVPETFDEHLKLLFDLQALAYQADITRVFTLMFAHDSSGSTYPVSGNRDGFHGASHHSNIPARMESFSLINKYHAQMLAYFLEKLKNTPDGDGSILDHSMILYGSSMSNANQHDHDPLPIVVAGGGSGTLKGGRHIVTPEHTPMSNLMLAMLDKLGVHQESFGDSTGKLDI